MVPDPIASMSNLLVGSIPGHGGEMNYIPTLPGQPTDDKHLA